MIRICLLLAALASLASAASAPSVPPPPSIATVTERFADASAAPTAPAAWRDGRFDLAPGDTVVFIGQENLVRESRGGELEARLAAGFPAAAPRFRSMAWEGDTVYEQWRDLNFGDWRAQLDAVGATVIVAQFGQVEAFDGPGRLAEFTTAYHHLLDQVAAGRRLVLLTPIAFEDPLAPRAPRLSTRNGDLALYAEAVRGIARTRGALVVDCTAVGARQPGGLRATDDGMHLTDAGRQQVADLVAAQLGCAVGEPEMLTALRNAIVEKNHLFFDCWRPANWNFVYGDRISQAFAKPAGNGPSLREVFEQQKPMIAAWDARIQAIAHQSPLPSAPAALALPGTDDVVPTPEQEQAAFTLAPGWSISLIASEADGVSKPTQISWDERGRLFVACSPTYPHTIPGVRPADYILALDHQGADGRFASIQRYAEGLTMVMGLEPGDGGMYVCDFDHLMHFRDPDGTGHATERSVVMGGFGIGDTHQLINSVRHGPDGCLWFTQGLHNIGRVETPWGLKRLDQAGVWRFDPKTLKLESFFNHAKAGANCWGVTVDDYGQVFHKTGDRPEGYWSVPGLVPLADPDEYHGIGSLFQSDRKTTALEFIGSAAMPDDLQGVAVLGGFFGNTIELHRLRDDGAGFASTQMPKLLRSSDPCFRPVDVRNGPDGALYVADWCTPVIGHYQASFADPKRDRRHGRIWRIARTDRPLVTPPQLAGLPPAALLGQLGSSERWVRMQVHRLLADGPRAAVLAATDAWVGTLPAGADADRLRFEALEVYVAHGEPRPALLATLLSAPDARLRAYAMRVVGTWSGQLAEPLALLATGVADANPRVRLEAIVACSRVDSPDAVAVAVRALAQPRDRFIDYALKGSVRALKPLWQAQLAQLTFADDAQAGYVRTLAAAVAVQAHPGKQIYDSLCLTCHQADAKGLPNIYPPLAGSPFVAGEPSVLIRIITHGLSGPLVVNGQTFGQQIPLPMPPMGLDDHQAANVLSYVRSMFGNHAPAVTADEVHAVRATISGRQQPWTPGELAP